MASFNAIGSEYTVELNVQSDALGYYGINRDVSCYSFSKISYNYYSAVKYANGGIYSETENNIVSEQTFTDNDANHVISDLNNLKNILNISNECLSELSNIVQNYVGNLYICHVDYPYSGTFIGYPQTYIASGILMTMRKSVDTSFVKV